MQRGPGARSGRRVNPWRRSLPRLRDPERMFPFERPRFAVPDARDPAQLVLMLRQATDSMEWMLVDLLEGVVPERPGMTRARTLDDVHVLRWIADHHATPAALAEFLGRSPQTVCARLDRLCEQGLVRRAGHGRDARLVTLGLTARGEEVVAEVNAVIEELTTVWVEDIEEMGGVVEHFCRILARMAQVS